MSQVRRALATVLTFAMTAIVIADVRAAELTFVLRIENGRVPENVRLIRVTQGDVVRLQWRSDRRVTLHLHGYDIEKVVAPGKVTSLMFTAYATGRFPINLHNDNADGHGNEEALVYLEVFPQ
jgi:hypothetical protein